MRTRLPSDLLERSAQESSRLLALSHLEQIAQAEERLSDPGDAEALHDFRVGLRRLRSSVQAYRMQLKGSVSGKMRDQLRELTGATNVGRDTEVQLTWLHKQAERLSPEDTQGFFWLTGRMEGRKLELLDPATAEVGRRFLKTAAKLKKRLGTLRIEVGPDSARKPATFGQVTGELVRRQVARLRDELLQVRDVNSVDEAHQARIAVKRLRYLLEPVARVNRRARALIPRLKALQDVLGEHHDMHVMSDAIASARTGLPATDAGPLAQLNGGLATLERLAGEEAAAAFERFHASGVGQPGDRILTRADEVGKALEVGPQPVGSPVAAVSPRPAGDGNGGPPVGATRVASDVHTPA